MPVQDVTSTASLLPAQEAATVQDDAGPGLGMGIAIMRELAQSVDVDRTRAGTRATMRFGHLSALRDVSAG